MLVKNPYILLTIQLDNNYIDMVEYLWKNKFEESDFVELIIASKFNWCAVMSTDTGLDNNCQLFLYNMHSQQCNNRVNMKP